MDRRSLQMSHRREHGEHEIPVRRICVERRVVQEVDDHATPLEFLDQRKRAPNQARQPVRRSDAQGVTLTYLPQHFLELLSRSVLTAEFVGEDPDAPGKDINLPPEVLIDRAHAHVADQHRFHLVGAPVGPSSRARSRPPALVTVHPCQDFPIDLLN